jgi:hypothetical protein
VTTNPVKKTKSNFGNLTKLVKDSAAKRRPPAAGKGRPKGSKNKTTALLKDAILMAANAAHKDSMVSYLQEQAINQVTPMTDVPTQKPKVGLDRSKPAAPRRAQRRAKRVDLQKGYFVPPFLHFLLIRLRLRRKGYGIPEPTARSSKVLCLAESIGVRGRGKWLPPKNLSSSG